MITTAESESNSRKKLCRHVVCLLSMFALLPSCAQWQDKEVTKESVSEVALSSSESPLESQKTVFGSNGDNVDEEPPALSADTYLGSDKTIRMPQNDSVIELEGQDVTLNFESTPLEDVVHGILGDTLKQDYVVEGKIPGVVSLRTQTPIPRKELLVILESMLDANGAAMVKRADGRYLVTASKRFRSANPSFQSRENLKPGYSNVIVPLQYIGAAHMAEVLKPVAPDSAFIRIDAVRNLLILGGGSTQLQGWLDIIQTFDVDYLSGMSVGVFPIEYTTADEINSALATLMATSVGDKASPLSGLIRTVPLESLGSVLVVTPRKELLAQVETWIERLDRLKVLSPSCMFIQSKTARPTI